MQSQTQKQTNKKKQPKKAAQNLQHAKKKFKCYPSKKFVYVTE